MPRWIKKTLTELGTTLLLIVVLVGVVTFGAKQVCEWRGGVYFYGFEFLGPKGCITKAHLPALIQRLEKDQ